VPQAGGLIPVGDGAAALDVHSDALILDLAAVRHLVGVLHVVLVLELDERVPARLAWVHAQWQPRRLPGAVTCGRFRRLHDVPEHLSSCKHGVTGERAAAAAASARLVGMSGSRGTACQQYPTLHVVSPGTGHDNPWGGCKHAEQL
jgi:hypothetical protein